MRVDEVGIDCERLAILHDRLVEPAHLQIQLGQGVVGVRIVGNEFDVFRKCLLGAGIVVVLPVGITKDVESSRVSRRDLSCFLVMLDGFGKNPAGRSSSPLH